MAHNGMPNKEELLTEIRGVSAVLTLAAINYTRENGTQAERVQVLREQRDDLLAACIEVCDWITDQFEEPNDIIVVQHLKSAIAKAKGA